MEGKLPIKLSHVKLSNQYHHQISTLYLQYKNQHKTNIITINKLKNNLFIPNLIQINKPQIQEEYLGLITKIFKYNLTLDSKIKTISIKLQIPKINNIKILLNKIIKQDQEMLHIFSSVIKINLLQYNQKRLYHR